MLIRRTRPAPVAALRKPLILRRQLRVRGPLDKVSQYPGAMGATVSDCGTYRYELWRRWGPGKLLTFIMLNPSTADALEDDPTIRRCIGYAKAMRYDGILVVNLFAVRATDPRELRTILNPVGPANAFALARAIEYAVGGAKASTVICAWGVPPPRLRYATHDSVGTILRDSSAHGCQLFALQVTKAGHPGHPLYLKKGLQPEPFDINAYVWDQGLAETPIQPFPWPAGDV